MQKYKKFSKLPNILVESCDFFSKKKKERVFAPYNFALVLAGGYSTEKARKRTHTAK